MGVRLQGPYSQLSRDGPNQQGLTGVFPWMGLLHFLSSGPLTSQNCA